MKVNLMSWQKRCWSLGPVGLWLLLVTGSAQATQPLESFLTRAQTQSFEAREAMGIEQQRAAEADMALSRLIPTFAARAVYTRNQEEVSAPLQNTGDRFVITPLNQLDALFQLDVPIIDLSSYHRYKSAQALARSAEAQRGATHVDVSRSVARAYYQFVGASALLQSAAESVSAAQANVQNVDDKRSAGAATDLDYERALASVARAQQDLADGQLGVALAARALESLSGLSPTPSDAFPEDDLHDEGSLQRWLDLARGTPGERAQAQLEEATSHSETAARRAFLPTLAGSAQERVTNATGFSGRTTAYTLQLILSWRLEYAGLSGVTAQTSALAVQRVRLERTQRAALDAAFEAYQRIAAGIAKSRAARAQAQAATRAALLSVDRYGVGVATQLDVTQAQRDAFLATAGRIQADSDLGYARVSLRLATGSSLSDTGASSVQK